MKWEYIGERALRDVVYGARDGENDDDSEYFRSLSQRCKANDGEIRRTDGARGISAA